MSGTNPDLVIDSVTGVEVAVPVAGPGARAYAFLVDWHLRAIIASGWYIVAAILYNGRWMLSGPLNPETTWFVWVIAPAAAIYFLYHLILEVLMHGLTPGKRIAGVHVVARDGGTPTTGALLTRNVFRLVDSLPAFYGVGLVATVVTHDHVRIGDLAAGTLLVYDRMERLASEPIGVAVAVRKALDPVAAELMNELLQRWPSLSSEARGRLARQALERYGVPAPGNDDASLRDQLEHLVHGKTGAESR